MKLSEIYNFLDQLSPFNIQESWDNSGILLGDKDGEISTVYLSLDIDENIIKEV
ncbi:Nif3-like dinuclear metal center hexameric protein, partial [Campylobacter jejuni]|nr:Nif3-like dinuclear metal center hexameric protein [Campylobacter jejuni]